MSIEHIFYHIYNLQIPMYIHSSVVLSRPLISTCSLAIFYLTTGFGAILSFEEISRLPYCPLYLLEIKYIS